MLNYILISLLTNFFKFTLVALSEIYHKPFWKSKVIKKIKNYILLKKNKNKYTVILMSWLKLIGLMNSCT
jgi:hypothetical protein